MGSNTFTYIGIFSYIAVEDPSKEMIALTSSGYVEA